MIEFLSIMPSWFIAVIFAITTLVGRAGASRVFFDVIGVFYAERMLKDAKAKMATLQSLALDGLSGIEDAAAMFGDKMAALVDDVIPIATKIADARIEFEKFVQQADDADRIAEEVVAIGEGFGFMADQALVAAARMAQLSSVVGPDVIPTATELGMQFGLIGGMETEEAMTKLINLQQQTNFMLGENTLEQFRAMDAQQQSNTVRQNTLRVMDQLNTIENRSAATMQHMTFVMNQFAAQADLAGESIAGMAAQSATLIEAGENSGKAGRALKQIYARIGADTSGAAQAFENLGVATKDQNGDMRSLTDLIREAQEGYKGLNGEAKTNFAITVAGTHHYARFIKLMENNTRTQELMLEAQFRLNPAMDEVNIRLQNQVTVLRQAQAELDRYKGALGDKLMPATIAATRAQADYNAALVSIFGGRGEGVLANMFAASEIIREVGASFYQNYVNVVQMNVALATQRTIMAALGGEQIVREDFMAAKMRQRVVHQLEISEEAREYGMLLSAQNNHVRAINFELMQQKMVASAITIEEEAQVHQKILGRSVDKGKLEFARHHLRIAHLSVQAAEREAGINRQIHALDQQNHIESLEHLIKELEAYEKIKNKRSKIAQEAFENLGILFAETMEVEEQLALMDENIVKQDAINHGILERHGLEAMTTEEVREQLLLHDAEIAKFDKETKSLIRQLALRRAITDAEKNKLAVQRQQREAADIRAETTAFGQQAVAMQELSLGIMAAGSALMMFSSGFKEAEHRQKAMRISMLLMNAAMIPQLFSMMKMTSQLFKNTLASSANTAAERLRTRSMVAATVKTVNLTTAQKGLTSAFIVGTGAGRVFDATIKSIAPMALAIGVAVLVDELLELVGIFESFDDMEMAELSNINVTVTDIVEAFKESTETASEQVAAISELNSELEIQKGLEGEIAREKQTALEEEIATREGILHLMDIQAIAEKESLQNKGMELARLMEQVEELQNQEFRLFALGEGSMLEKPSDVLLTPIGFGPGHRRDKAIEDLFEEIQRLEDTFPTLERFFDEKGIDSVEDFTAALEDGLDVLDLIAQDTDTGVGAVVTHIENATDALNDFNSSREELFFGFKAGNVTGDLIRQIEQKGVENFVANTEIIMTNNFNGMTTDEVADEILAKIDERAALQGINVALT